MATLVLSAAGAALGGALGSGTVLGLSGAAIGKAVGASIGSAIDQKLLGSGSAPVHSGKLDTLRIQGASEGAAVPRVFGQMRVAGNVIWASRFLETKSKSGGGGKGNTRTVISYSYSVSLAVALCEGEVTRIGRVWADGTEMSLSGVTWRLVPGTDDQLADPLIQAIEGVEHAPAYRGVAYIVFENLDLSPFGNRVPQFNVEVIRKVKERGADAPAEPFDALRSVALVPGSGEYALAITPVKFDHGKSGTKTINVNNVDGVSDLEASMGQLDLELAQVESVSLVVSWFGDDLRCGNCRVEPKVEQNGTDPVNMPWRAAGIDRAVASVVSQIDGRPAFGGTPTDQSVVEAIQHIKAGGREVMFYPFVLMDVPQNNGLPDPWTGASDQPVFPWRGRITASIAPGLSGSPDKTAAVVAEIDGFFGTAAPGDFALAGGQVTYSGPSEWSYRRFVLHNAMLCQLAGGVETFIIGSELRGLTSLRAANDAFPAVSHLISLAADVRSILGSGTKISYAADWSEYFGYHPTDGSGDVFFHLDPLWADANIDFVGIDNYMPLSDWRDDDVHLDMAHRSIYDLAYLTGNVAGGEGFDWYYANAADREAQIRQPILDGAHGEDWLFRYKELKSWWSQPHHNRPGGVRSAAPTVWVPESKPIWFTELGCPAIDKGTNQPNVFFDPKSSESFAPYFSNENRDDFIQYRYLQAHAEHWADVQNNPVSVVYAEPMVRFDRAHVWAWDARPWPDFPNNINVWSDGENYGTGHWISGRVGNATLPAIVSDIAERAGFSDYDVSKLHGTVHGYVIGEAETPRQSLQPLMLSHGFDGFEIGDKVAFRNRYGRMDATLNPEEAVREDGEDPVSRTRAAKPETASQVQVRYYSAGNDYQSGAASAGIEGEAEPTVSQTDLPVAMSDADGRLVAARWITEANVARDSATFSLPLSRMSVTAGDVVEIDTGSGAELYRVDRIEETTRRVCEATRVEPGVYQAGDRDDDPLKPPSYTLPSPAYVTFVDLPVIASTDIPHAPLVAASSVPWLGPLACYSSSSDSGYDLNTDITAATVFGTLTSSLPARAPGLWSWNAPLQVSIPAGELTSRTALEVLNGANIAAVRAVGATDWEILQFQSATLVQAGEYELDGLLRGQFGTEPFIASDLAAGSDFLLLDGAAAQINLDVSERGLERHYRIGPATRGYDDPSYVHVQASFDGVGLRPYAPTHLKVAAAGSGDLDISWVRRTRIDGDNWTGIDVPLGEDSEVYMVTILNGSTVLRTETVTAPQWTYSSADQLIDGATLPLEIRVAQVSVQFGPGPFERITYNG